jgi:hypothetical protein
MAPKAKSTETSENLILPPPIDLDHIPLADKDYKITNPKCEFDFFELHFWLKDIYWLWSLIIFLIQRFLFSVLFIPHEYFTPHKNLHSSTWGSAKGGYPLCGFRGRSPQRKNCLVNVYCNFIVNMYRSL